MKSRRKYCDHHLAGFIVTDQRGAVSCRIQLIPLLEFNFPLSTRYVYGVFDLLDGRQVGHIIRGAIHLYAGSQPFKLYAIRPRITDLLG